MLMAEVCTPLVSCQFTSLQLSGTSPCCAADNLPHYRLVHISFFWHQDTQTLLQCKHSISSEQKQQYGALYHFDTFIVSDKCIYPRYRLLEPLLIPKVVKGTVGKILHA